MMERRKERVGERERKRERKREVKRKREKQREREGRRERERERERRRDREGRREGGDGKRVEERTNGVDERLNERKRYSYCKLHKIPQFVWHTQRYLQRADNFPWTIHIIL
ncbi:hypothetical protein Bpfe_018411 [Biomphalaria pfeifferi]|uniref:Uncharacterized protein n=1 Tax=Biomphalaria pfeifferi TaxID=112525 RepID=A0AAD8BD15_BIOPF|nr:hypothetical protein Bpfe_018411 [Biomphalaria pfeifferi]